MSHWFDCGLRARFAVSLLSTFFVGIALAGAASAQTFTLSGVVTGGGSPINGATVEALTNGTTTAAGASLTNSAGQFSIGLPPAVYDLRVTPPSASGYGVEILQDVDLTASNQQVDVILLASTAALTGTVRGLNGAPVTAVTVNVWSWPNFIFQGTGQTNASGVYTVPINANPVYIEVSRSGPTSSAPAGFWFVSRSNVTVTPGAAVDFNLPVAVVSGTLTDAGGNPVVNGTVTTSGSGNSTSPQMNWSSNGSSGTNAAGAYSLILFTGSSIDFTARPPSGSPLPTFLERGVAVTGDMTKNIALPAASSLGGTVRGAGGQPVPAVSVQARAISSGTLLASTATATDGTYLLTLPAGNVNLTFNRSGPAGVAPNSSWSVSRTNVAVSGSTSLNIDLPVVTITGNTVNASGVPVPSATIVGDSFGSDAQGSWSANASVLSTAPAGGHSLILFTGAANFSVRPPSGTTSATLVERGIGLVTDVARDFVLPVANLLSGVVRGVGGQPVGGVSITVTNTNGIFLGSTSTDANGNYTLGVPAGILGAVSFNRGSFSAVAPNSWSFRRSNLAVNGATSFDLSLNVIRLNGSAVDSNGSPVPNVNVQVNSGRGFMGSDQTDWSSAASVNTAATGAYSALLLTGSGSVTIRPPTNSGFSQATLNSVTFANNLTQRIVLQRPDTTAPIIVSGPAVLHLSDTSVSIGWTTNEPSTSVVDYGIGGFGEQAGSGALVTNHTVTLQGLTPNEIYSFRVSSRDGSNNGPAQSATDFFTMLSPPGDVTPPSILAGPGAAFTGDTSVVIQWVTNEPATSLVRWGAAADALNNATAPAPGEFVALHGRLLSGLTPSTDYFAQVESTDPDGNQIQSSIFTFRTAAAPDIQAPVVTSAPTVVGRTHNSATIRWTTDEAATSGVSYNDGSVFNLTSSDVLTTTHEIVLAGLSPSRTYNFTAASKDAAGNGPTLAGPFSFMTLAAPDVTPPAFASALAIDAVTKNSLQLRWNTDEPATKVVRFGTVSGALDRIASDLSLQTSHQVTLTGLLPGTRYYFTRQVADASGNAAMSPEESAETLPEDINTPPTPPSPVTATPNPGNTGTFTITWGAPTDDGPGGVKDVQVLSADLQAVSPLLEPTTTSYQITGAAEGSHTYRIKATDFNDASSLSDPITVVVDLTAPSLNLPSPISTPATTNTDAIVTFTVTAADNIDPDPVESCSPASGSAFPIGPTTVMCTGRDAAGNLVSGSFVVTVTDPFPPILTVPAGISLQAENQNGAVVNFTATATDNHDPDPDVSCSPPSGSVFPVGTTLVICTATDASGNTATRSFNVAIGAPPKVASSIVLESSSAAATFGQPVVFTATVHGTSGSTPTGNVQFLDGTTVVGQAALAAPAGGTGSPTASLTIATLGAGTRSITAGYAGDPGHESSTSTAIALEIARAQPTITVTGGTFVYDAAPHAATGTVTGVDGTSIGSLTFSYDGAAAVPIAAGSYAVVGSFAGTDNYEAGSAPGTLIINPGPTQTVAQPGPAIVFGQPATIGASVTSPTGEVPQGSVEFFDGAASLGTAVLNAAGGAQIVVPAPRPGTHTISAVYSGGGNFAGSVSAAAALEVARASTTTSLTVQPNPSGTLEAFKLTATVAVAPPGAGVAAGAIEFFAGPTSLGNATLALVGGVPTAVLTLNGFPAGTYPLTARYVGNASFAPSTSAEVSHTVRGLDSSTWTVLTVAPTPSSRVNTNVTLRAVVVPLAGTVQPTGMVQFYAWSSPVGSPVALANVGGAMTATLTTAALPSGVMQLRARYLGDGGFSPSTSTPVSHTIYATTAPFATTTAMTLSANPIAFGDSLTATVSVSSGTRPTPGYFLLTVDGVLTQAVPVVSGSPTSFVVPNLGRGLHGVTVQFYPSTTTLAASVAHMFVFVQ